MRPFKQREVDVRTYHVIHWQHNSALFAFFGWMASRIPSCSNEMRTMLYWVERCSQHQEAIIGRSRIVPVDECLAVLRQLVRVSSETMTRQTSGKKKKGQHAREVWPISAHKRRRSRRCECCHCRFIGQWVCVRPEVDSITWVEGKAIRTKEMRQFRRDKRCLRFSFVVRTGFSDTWNIMASKACTTVFESWEILFATLFLMTMWKNSELAVLFLCFFRAPVKVKIASLTQKTIESRFRSEKHLKKYFCFVHIGATTPHWVSQCSKTQPQQRCV